MSIADDDFHSLIRVIDRLLGPDGCPWDKEQTVLSLSHMVLEEVCEVIDTLRDAEPERLADELGDLIIGAMFLAKAAEKEHRFAWERPFQKATEKLIRRHPHIFTEDQKITTVQEVEKQWDEIKSTEAEHLGRKSRFDGIPRSLPSLSMMQKLLGKTKKSVPLHQTIQNLIEKECPEEDEDIARRITAHILEAEEKGIQAEQALRIFFATCRDTLIEQEKTLNSCQSDSEI